ncbi:hypothetical protein REPUB_Repub13aG0082700 [Reevesia pubescens]
MAAFAYPDDELEIGPLDSMVDDHHRPRMYQKVQYVDNVRQVLARKTEGKAHTDLVKIENKQLLLFYGNSVLLDEVWQVNMCTDIDTLTLLLQDDEIPGLQIKHKDEWFLVKPIRNAIVVNIGDVLQIQASALFTI